MSAKSLSIALFSLALTFHGGAAMAQDIPVSVQEKPELKAVFGQVQSRSLSVARARIGGTVTELKVTEGTSVKSGDSIAFVVDDKLALQLRATDSRIKSVESELKNASVELARAKKLQANGIVAITKTDALQTQYDVLLNQVKALEADRAIIEQQAAEGEVLAPASGRVLAVPVTKGSVIMPGEPIARIASNGYFIRLSLPERHAAQLREGDDVLIGKRGLDPRSAVAASSTGKLVKVYPELENGRVLADVEVEGLGDFFVGERTPVWVPVARRQVLSVPAAAVSNSSGVDYVTLADGTQVAVIIGETFLSGNAEQVEILSGLAAGDVVKTP